MANRDDHAAAGFFLGALVGLLTANPKNGAEAFAAGALGALAGVAGAGTPDVLEPAFHPNHRSTAHSLTVGAGVTYATVRAVRTGIDQPMDDVGSRLARSTAAAYGVGYASHLLLDGGTPKGLPVL